MIPEKEKDCTNSSALKFKVVVHNFPIRSPMPIHIDGLIGLHSWCKVYLTCGEREKKKKASGLIPVGIGVSQHHYSKNIGPYPESPSIFQGLKENLKDALSHSLSATAGDFTGWCSAVLKLSFALGKKGMR